MNVLNKVLNKVKQRYDIDLKDIWEVNGIKDFEYFKIKLNDECNTKFKELIKYDIVTVIQNKREREDFVLSVLCMRLTMGSLGNYRKRMGD